MTKVEHYSVRVAGERVWSGVDLCRLGRIILH